MTLKQMLDECKTYLDLAALKATDITRLKSSLNYAYKKIVKENYPLNFQESFVIDDSLTIPISMLSKKFTKLNDTSVRYYNGNIYFNYVNSGDTVTVDYYYLPSDLVNDSDIPELPEEIIDHKLLCYFAVSQYLTIENDGNPQYWLDLFVDGVANIDTSKNKVDTIQEIYGW